MLEVNDKAPSFSLKNQDGKTFKLSDYKGKKLALYFYPRDNNHGCTAQACNIRDNYSALKKNGITVLGISKDSVESHKKFSKKFEFDFPILADEETTVIEKYGVFKKKSMFGKSFMGIKRTTFLIDEKGRIKGIIISPQVGEHAKEIIERFES
ncbi:thioredoxin-dependent thiol peroxidase [archaeon]|nr:thioredoxin-dependent thiol peroxidase [archaeon]